MIHGRRTDTCLLKKRRPAFSKSHQRSWWTVHTQPTQRSGGLFQNPTNAVGGLFILSLPKEAAPGSSNRKPTPATADSGR